MPRSPRGRIGAIDSMHNGNNDIVIVVMVLENLHPQCRDHDGQNKIVVCVEGFGVWMASSMSPSPSNAKQLSL